MKMIRIIFVILRYLPFIPLWFYKMWKYGRSDKYTEQERYDNIRHIARKVTDGGKINLKVYGKEHLPEKDGFIMFPNHQGHFDVVSFLYCMERPLTVVIKKESGQIVFLNQVVNSLRGLRMDHSDIRQSMKVIMQMAQEVKQGRNYIIFPEGKRTEKNGTAGFKAGSFKGATMSQCPIVPVALIDSYKVFNVNSLKPVEVGLHFLEPLYYSEYKGMKTTEIAGIVENRIRQKIKEEISK